MHFIKSYNSIEAMPSILILLLFFQGIYQIVQSFDFLLGDVEVFNQLTSSTLQKHYLVLQNLIITALEKP